MALLSPDYVGRALEAVSSPLGLLVMVVHQGPFEAGISALRVLLLAVAVGVLWLHPRALHRWRRLVVPVAVLGASAVAVGALWVHDVVGGSAARDEARHLSETEAVLVGLTPQLLSLGESVADLVLPNARSAVHFADEVEWLGALASPGPTEPLVLDVLSTPWTLQATPLPTGPRRWEAWLGSLHHVEHASFVLEDGELSADAMRFDGALQFSATARATAGPWTHAKARQSVRWERAGLEAPWRIVRWQQRSFDTTAVPRRLFRDDIIRAIPDEATRARAERSIHEEHVLRAIQHPEHPDPHPLFQVPSADRHPAIAVVDIEGDGDDDLYVMARWGTNLLLRNRGDGTFESAEHELGLDVADHSSAAVFADFDNDGDPDLFLGRTLAPSVYLVNEGGRFVDRTATLIEGPAPTLVSSVAAADHDRDGLLDLYVATFAIDVAAHDATAALLRGTLLPDLLPEQDARAFHERFFSEEMHPILASVGPPNVLLRNLGDGRFGRSASPGAERLFRNTYQASFSDVDGDGDPDLYCANDVAENTLLINEGGTFVDATAQTRTADIGFGMGVSFGDYNRDGRQDLYVTNMYSKAGKRITARLDRLDPKYAAMAGGNTLFRNDGSHFTKVSGLEAPALQVERAGWGWGGQLVDLDGDGFLDIYTLSGYFTAPPEVALPVDT